MSRINQKLMGSILVIVIAYAMIFSILHSKTTSVWNRHGNKIILIDPGHGGVDGGAVSANGTIEKDITLEISLKLRDELKKKGFKVFMTREEDKGLYGNEETIRKKKYVDLAKRTKMKQDVGCDAFVSIHLNKFAQTQYYGAEIYHSKREDSKQLASVIMNKLKSELKDGNRREIKPAGTRFKILREQDNMAGIIIECGFISNPREEKLLKTAEYQKKLAKIIAEGILEYYKSN